MAVPAVAAGMATLGAQETHPLLLQVKVITAEQEVPQVEIVAAEVAVERLLPDQMHPLTETAVMAAQEQHHLSQVHL